MFTISFDPGVTTGYSIFKDNELHDSGEFHMYSKVNSLINQYNPEAVIIERFLLYPHKANKKVFDTFPEIEVIGVMKYLCEIKGIPYFLQNASQKDFFTNKMIIGMFSKASSRHAYDAIRHSLVFFTFGKGKEYGYANDIIRRAKENKI